MQSPVDDLATARQLNLSFLHITYNLAQHSLGNFQILWHNAFHHSLIMRFRNWHTRLMHLGTLGG